MGNAEPFGDLAGVVDVLAGAAGALAMRRRAMVVELQGDADDVVALAAEQRGDDRGIRRRPTSPRPPASSPAAWRARACSRARPVAGRRLRRSPGPRKEAHAACLTCSFGSCAPRPASGPHANTNDHSRGQKQLPRALVPLWARRAAPSRAAAQRAGEVPHMPREGFATRDGKDFEIISRKLRMQMQKKAPVCLGKS